MLKGAGWKSGADEETVGHESGRKIMYVPSSTAEYYADVLLRDILERNPNKEEDKYTEEDLQHMRKVVSYCKRHLAQEDKLKDTKSPEELEGMKSTKSLKVCLVLMFLSM